MTKRLSLVASFVLLLAVPAMAQRSTATIRGVVSDPTNAVVSGAKVTIKNEETGLSRSGTTNSSGIYSFQDLPVGSYRLEVEYPGFKAESRSKILLNVADNKSLDIQLTTGNVTETVNVETAAVSVSTTGGEVAGPLTRPHDPRRPLQAGHLPPLAPHLPPVRGPAT